MENLLLAVVLCPFAGFLINGLARNSVSKGFVSFLGCAMVLIPFICSILLFQEVRQNGGSVVHFFDFINAGIVKIPFAFQVDELSTVFLLIITGVGFLIHLYSTAYMHEETRPHFARYFAYLNLFIFSMLLLVLGANYVILFIGWEGVGLCSYLLIGYWFKNIDYTKAAKKAFVMNRIGDLGFLLAIFWMIQHFGSVSFAELFNPNNGIVTSMSAQDTTAITGITLLLFLGATGKSAQIPLFTWLPDAMAGPTPVSALIHAATMVTAGIYMIARSNVLYNLAPFTLSVVAIIGAATALLAATIALRQNDIKKVLAYSTVSQLGYMFLALGMGAYTAAVFHVMTHAFFKALLFLGSGSVIHAVSGQQDIRFMGGLRSKMKITYATFLIGCIAIAGIAPLSGFFSKDAILLSAFEHDKFLYVIGLITAGLTAFYMFRLLFLTFFGSFRGTDEQRHHIHESPAAMTIPLLVLAILSIIGGFLGVPEALGGTDRLGDWLAPVVSQVIHHIDHTTEYLLMALTTAIALVAIFIAWRRYGKYREEQNGSFGRLLQNKWYVDEVYHSVFVNPVNRLSYFVNRYFERPVIDGIVNGLGRLVHYGSRQMRWLQSGQIGSYVLLMVVSMLVFFVLQFFLRK